MSAAILEPQVSKYTIQRIEKKLQLKAGFLTGRERYALRVRAEQDSSYWNFKRFVVQLGIKGFDEGNVEPLAWLLMRHEIGHVRWTDRELDVENLGYPFDLLNILEDARIEALDGSDFKPLFEHIYRTVYLAAGEKEQEMKANPFNIGILLRWRHYGLETETAMPPALSEEEYDEFLADWDSAITGSIAAKDTGAVSKIAKELYLKWKELFDSAKKTGATIVAGLSEKDLEGLFGKGVDTDPDAEKGTVVVAGGSEPGKGIKTSDDTCPVKDANNFHDAWFDWDMSFITTQTALIRRFLKPPDNAETAYEMSGRRFSIKRIENPPMVPFKKLISSYRTKFEKRVMLVLDGSGSMHNAPWRDGAHIAYILSGIFPLDIYVVTTCNSLPTHITDLEDLRRYCPSGAENYRSLQEMAKKTRYAFGLFLTDAEVEDEDKVFVRDVLSRQMRVGAGYVGDNQSLADVFPVNFYAETLSQKVGMMIALFLKRHFLRS